MRKRPGNYQQIVVRAKQSAYMPDGTNLQNRGVGVRRGSDWQEIDGGTGSSNRCKLLLLQPKSILLLITNFPDKIIRIKIDGG